MSAPRIAELQVERVVPGGAGLGRVDGVVALVEGALPGDRVRAELVERQPGLLTGHALELLGAGPHRRGAICPSALDRSCGGCDWPAARLESHGELKTALVLDALKRTGRLPPEEIPAIRYLGSPFGYRLRNRFHLSEARLGFLAPRSHRVADLSACELISPALRDKLPELARLLAPAAPAELVTLEGREGTPLLGELRADHPVPDARALASAAMGLLHGLRVRTPVETVTQGDTSLVIEAAGARFHVSVSSFFQGNRYLLDSFLEEVRAALAACGEIRNAIDLYAGVGFLTRPLLETRARLTAVEAEPSAAADLRRNLDEWRREGLPAARAVEGTAEELLRGVRGADVVVLDPPRVGTSRTVRRELLRLAPRALVSISCDPATFARDASQLLARYRLERLVLLDLFPGTHHVELLSVFLPRRT